MLGTKLKLAAAGVDPYAGMDLYEVLVDLGLTSNLWCVLDAGDITSYAGSGSTWSDLSGSGHNATLGGGSNDPVFQGAPGNHSSNEYFLFDGNDKITFANDSFIEGLHKNNAGPLTILFIYSGPNDGTQTLLSTDSDPETVGIQLRRLSGETLNFRVGNSGVVYSRSTNATFGNNKWGLSGIGYTESSSSGYLYVEGVGETISGNYSSPSSSSAATDLTVGQKDGANPLDDGSKVAGVLIWQTELSVTNVDAIRDALAQRFGW